MLEHDPYELFRTRDPIRKKPSPEEKFGFVLAAALVFAAFGVCIYFALGGFADFVIEFEKAKAGR